MFRPASLSLLMSLPDTVRSIPVEVGFSLIDAKTHHAAAHLDTLQVGLSRTRTGYLEGVSPTPTRPRVKSETGAEGKACVLFQTDR